MDKPSLIMSDHIGGVSPDMADFLSLGPYVSSPVRDKKGELGIDLNKTPELKPPPPPPKRRKHRPKVFVEGKTKRTPKPKGAETAAKRKYVRKTVPEKTCKKALNFDLEKLPHEDRSEPELRGRDDSVAVDDEDRASGIAPSVERNFMFINETSNGFISVDPPPLSFNKDKEIFEVDPVELEKVKQLLQMAFQPMPATPAKLYEEARGSKRDYSRTVHSLLNGEMRTVDEVQMDKRKKIVDEYTQNQGGLPFDVGVAQGGLRKPEKKKKKKTTTTTTASHNINLIAHKLKQTYSAHFSMLDGRFINDTGVSETGHYEASKFYGSEHCRNIAPRPHFPNQQVSLMPHSHPGNTGSTSAYSPYMNFLPVNSARQGQGQMLQASYICVPEKYYAPATPGIKAASAGASKAKETVPKRKGPKKKNSQLTPIDEIIYRLQNLNLNGSSDKLQGKEQNALVLYNGGGTLVPYQGADPIKRRKPRPKVNLDPETNRIWNLLMGQAVSEDAEENDEKKAKWWENERKVFRGRVDSFIARMHLIQGDRRFSRWKGSVVDSVIGVFLTQNVSDHLSSSAFMCMAARFPLKSGGTQAKARENVIDAEVPITVLNPDDTIKWHEASETTNNQSDTTGTGRGLILSQDSFDSSITKVAGGIRSCSGSNSETEDPYTGLKRRNGQVSALATENSYLVQEVCSENGSTVLNEKCKYGMTEISQSSSGITSHPSHLSPTGHQCMQQPCPCGNNWSMASKVSEVWLREIFSEESTSSWQSPLASVSAKGPEAVSESSRRGEVAGSWGNFSMEQLGLWGSQEESTPTDCNPIFSTDLTNQQGNPDLVYNQFCIEYQREWNKMFGMDSASSTEPVKQAEALNKKRNETMEIVNKHGENIANDGDSSSAVNMQTSGENKLVEANSKEQITPSDHASKVTKPKSSRTRNGNLESDKKKAIDWDDLRKKVEGNVTKKERPKEAMDSLDYEAVRTANVSEISETIKERGMNNMLAERMKEFLNRVVKDHGSIDLEWLRDVPPDKAKDYLLSIRGLGLKSVECVRLLSLHHLAFPVDTNVGRIAVRLGWVPLQPLPESLQLHLLELYPILETIQKYLWPRLCKLDQLTLYELHYQMITFGKVFCTKSKPNCNACPMRGECRHFASAFASARLALPAPEDRSIVSSTVSPTADNNPGVVIHPMPLPPPEQGSIIEVGSNNRCEPIIEEPATPEPERIDISESDIEDFEDPNEIPTIKLSMPEFTKNLQDYMQNNMELQEADMSKALVALSPYMASIPIPKLKNISRLRTEHRVYELPDSHPLLERFERREPDDPSPYLLAIWTPGETANSVQPSERSCGCEADKLCSDVTCFSCNSARETNSQTVRGTILIPCRTAMRGSFPLNGTYFQVNEMFADHESSLDPINVPREWIWNLPRRTVYFGTSVSTIFKGLTTEGIQYCFWKGFVCVRGFDTATRAPRPLKARLHFPASKLVKTKKDEKK